MNRPTYTRKQKLAINMWLMQCNNMEKDEYKFIINNHSNEEIKELAKTKYKSTKRVAARGIDLGPTIKEYVPVHKRKEFIKQILNYWKSNQNATYDDLYEIFGSAYVSRDHLIEIINRAKKTRRPSNAIHMSNLARIAKTPELYNKPFWRVRKKTNGT